MPDITTGFLLAEEKALKQKFKGWVTVEDFHRQGSDARPVAVYFRYPQNELREVEFPFITLDLNDIQFAASRAHNWHHFPTTYIPPGYDDPNPGTNETTVAVNPPEPVILIFQIITWSRDPRHDRQIMQKMMTDPHLLPERVGYLYIEEDDTQRSMFRIGHQPVVTRDEDGERIFQHVFQASVFSEVWYTDLENRQQVESVDIDLNDYEPVEEEETQSSFESIQVNIGTFT